MAETASTTGRQRFNGNVMLITGGASGIGLATAMCAAAEGAAIGIIDKNGGAARRIETNLDRSGAKALAIEADITDETQVEAAVDRIAEKLGPIGVLVNNAGAALTDTFEALDARRWRAEIELNLTGAYLVTRAALPHMRKRPKGAIVNIATVNAVASIAEPGYSAAKAGLLQLTRQLAVAYAPLGIRTNAVLPGSIRTPLWDKRLAERPQLLDILSRWYPVGRIGEPEDVAAAILFLASPEAAFINGASLLVDGGLMAGLPRMTQDILGP